MSAGDGKPGGADARGKKNRERNARGGGKPGSDKPGAGKSGKPGGARRPDGARPAHAASRPGRKEARGLPARRAAVDVLGKVVHEHRMAASEFDAAGGNSFYRELAANDRALVRAIVGVALRRRGQIADLLEELLDRPIPEKTGRAEDILHVAIAQILFMDVADHAAVSLAVEQAGGDRKARPYKGLVNAVLRRLIREREALVAAQDPVALNAPDWLMARWTRSFGSETARAIAAAHMEEPGLDLTLKGGEDRDEWARKLGATVVATGSLRLAEPGRVEELAGYEDGVWWVQDAAAALPARLLGDVKGLRVADLCAAPGGKSAQLADAGAIVTAVDISKGRLTRVSQNMARLGLEVEMVAADLGEWNPEAPFDAILLDAPCSATGTARRHPDMPWLKREADIAALHEMQARFLRRALDWLKPGGVMVYCTCSLEPEEGEAQITALLGENLPVERVPLRPDEFAGLEGLVNETGDLRTLPSLWPSETPHMGGLDGFFACRLRRTA